MVFLKKVGYSEAVKVAIGYIDIIVPIF